MINDSYDVLLELKKAKPKPKSKDFLKKKAGPAMKKAVNQLHHNVNIGHKA